MGFSRYDSLAVHSNAIIELQNILWIQNAKLQHLIMYLICSIAAKLNKHMGTLLSTVQVSIIQTPVCQLKYKSALNLFEAHWFIYKTLLSYLTKYSNKTYICWQNMLIEQSLGLKFRSSVSQKSDIKTNIICRPHKLISSFLSFSAQNNSVGKLLLYIVVKIIS